MKRGKEIKLNINDNYNVVTGTVDNKNPKSIYIVICGWGDPTLDNDIDYTRVINDINKNIRQTLYNDINKNRFDHNQMVVDLDMRESGIKFNKRSYMCCEITLFQNHPLLPITSEELLDNIKDVSNDILNNVFDKNVYFTFHQRKK